MEYFQSSDYMTDSMIVILRDWSLLLESLLINYSWKSLYFSPIGEWCYTQEIFPLSQAMHFQEGKIHHEDLKNHKNSSGHLKFICGHGTKIFNTSRYASK